MQVTIQGGISAPQLDIAPSSSDRSNAELNVGAVALSDAAQNRSWDRDRAVHCYGIRTASSQEVSHDNQ
jgi:hypothetical protein